MSSKGGALWSSNGYVATVKGEGRRLMREEEDKEGSNGKAKSEQLKEGSEKGGGRGERKRGREEMGRGREGKGGEEGEEREKGEAVQGEKKQKRNRKNLEDIELGDRARAIARTHREYVPV